MSYVLTASYFVFFFKQKTAYEMRISDWSSDVCSSDLHRGIDRGAEAVARQLRGDAGEGVVEVLHEQRAHDIQHQHLLAAPGLEHAAAAPGRAGRKVVRAQQARLAGDVGHHLALVPAMVAAGDDVGPGFEKLAADLVGDTEAGGRVLAVHDDEVEAEALAQPREMRRNSIAARPADHIPAELNSHEPYAYLAGCARSEEHTSELQSL